MRDLFTGLAAARLFSRLMLVVGVAPILAPTLGGMALNWTSWRGVFVVLAVFGVAIMAAAALVLPETLPVERRRNGGVLGTVRDYGRLFTDRVYVGLILVAGLAMAALFAYVSGSSFVFQDGYGLSEQQFGFVFAGGAVGLIGATQLNVRLLRRWTPQQILGRSLAGRRGFGLVLLVLAATGVRRPGGHPVPLWLVLASAGLAMPNAPALALSRHGEAAGTAAALLGAVQFGVGALAAPLVGVLGIGAVGMADRRLRRHAGRHPGLLPGGPAASVSRSRSGCLPADRRFVGGVRDELLGRRRVHAQRGQHPGAVLLLQQPQQDMPGADPLVAEPQGRPERQLERLLRPGVVGDQHRIGVAARRQGRDHRVPRLPEVDTLRAQGTGPGALAAEQAEDEVRGDHLGVAGLLGLAHAGDDRGAGGLGEPLEAVRRVGVGFADEPLLRGLLGDAHAAADLGPRCAGPAGLVDEVADQMVGDLADVVGRSAPRRRAGRGLRSGSG